jgi:hypothetical protein
MRWVAGLRCDPRGDEEAGGGPHERHIAVQDTPVATPHIAPVTTPHMAAQDTPVTTSQLWNRQLVR